jgi:MFS family permease
MGGLGGVIITLVGAQLYAADIALPFIVADVLVLAALLMLVFFVKEPRELADPGEARDEDVGLGVIKNLRKVAPASRRSLFLLLLSILLWFVGYNAIETFFTSYGVNVLGISENRAALLGSVAYVTFILFAIPSGYIAAKIGRKRTITLGLLIFAGLLAVGYFTPNATVIGALLGLGGIAWSMVNINSLPMVIDTAESDASIGTYTGFYYFASQIAAIAGPTLNGFVIERSGNYNMVMLMPVIFFALAALTMQGVTRGEAR